MGSKTLLTLEDFECLTPEEGKLFELDEGELRTMSPGRPRHNRVRDRIARRLAEFVEKGELGEVFVETEFRLTGDTVRIPDAAFVRADRVKQIDPDLPINGAPALAIEVVSPTDLAEDLTRKVDQYLTSGSEAAWVVCPKVREVHTYEASGVSRTLRAESHLDGGQVFPGFSLPVGSLFD